MPLPTGARLGQYDVLSKLGAGGMGEVYRARDTKLGRDVALKVLPGIFTHDPERLARFRREAQVLASLNHPHIAGIYGVEHIDGYDFLVLELVDGETLAERLQRGALPVEEALSLGREIAGALDAAHERGIVHRDLKPANIALTAENDVKVLDFGLARPTGADAASRQSDLVNSPTITSPLTLTRLGVILGTAAYMSPEQAKGAVADKRADVWAFGCVLYEMLTGRRAFPGEDVSDTLAAVLRGEPDWSALPAALPSPIRALLDGCLEKDRRRRIGDISVARFVLERGAALAVPAAPPRVGQPAWRSTLLLLAAVIAGAATTWFALEMMRAPAPGPIVTRFTIQLPPGQELAQTRRAIAISPDGSRIVYGADGRLFIRSISDFEAQPLPGTESGLQPVFSPEGQVLLFWADGALKRIPLGGGVPVTLAEVAPAPFSLTWSQPGIVSTESRGIVRLAPNVGASDVLVPFKEIDGVAQGARLLADGDTLLFALSGVTGAPSNFWDIGKIVVQSIRTGERKVLIEGGSNPHYLDTGHIVYGLEGTLMAVAFDAQKREVLAGPVPVVAGVRRSAPAAGGEAHFSISDSGTLVYAPGPARAGQQSIFLYGNDGKAQGLNLPKGTYSHPRVSPKGEWLAFENHDGKESWIAVYHLSGRTAAQRLTFGGHSRFPVWTADGKRIVFQSDREGDLALYWQPVNGGVAERLTKPDAGTSHVPESWSPLDDGLLFSVNRGTTHELWLLSMPDRKASAFGGVRSDVFPPTATFSPDGRWVAYQAGDAGAGEAMTYVQPFPPTDARTYQIDRGGRPLWSPDGGTLFFVPAPQQFKSVSVTATAGSFEFTAPESLPRRFGLAPPNHPRPFDILPDGRIVGINTPPDTDTTPNRIHVVQNWTEELKTKVPFPR
jgi:eukaryotic-like serine/threonine-protein kinase